MTTAIDFNHPAFQELLDRERRFEASRPPCPSEWCDGECDSDAHFGDATMHYSRFNPVPVAAERLNEPDGVVLVRAWRHDRLDEASTSGIELDLSEARALISDSANFTADQARQLAAVLLAAADQIAPRAAGGGRR